MIKFSLKCPRDHRFESWFQSSDAYEKLRKAGRVTCAICGSPDVDKAMMAPRLGDAGAARPEAGHPQAAGPPAATPDVQGAQARALAEMKRRIEADADYVGRAFSQEARDMHDGLIPMRAIYGEAKPEDARKLIEDGVPVAPLPFLPTRKAN